MNREETGSHEIVALEPGQLVAWQCSVPAPVLRCAGTERGWMDDADQRFPYRCLPLVLANSFGWDMINPASFTAIWNGGPHPSDVTIQVDRSVNPLPMAHFGCGVLTFTTGHLFQTAPGVNLYVKGPANELKDGLIPLEGIIETDWCPATFTMNWRFTRPHHPVVFEAGESYCRFFPVPRRITEDLEPEIRRLEDNPPLQALHTAWRTKRSEFNQGLTVPGSEYVKRGWQKEYFQGGGGEVWPKFGDHQTRLRQKEFLDFRPAGMRQSDLGVTSKTHPVSVVGRDGRPQVIMVSSLESEEKDLCPYRFPDGKSC